MFINCISFVIMVIIIISISSISNNSSSIVSSFSPSARSMQIIWCYALSPLILVLHHSLTHYIPLLNHKYDPLLFTLPLPCTAIFTQIPSCVFRHYRCIFCINLCCSFINIRGASWRNIGAIPRYLFNHLFFAMHKKIQHNLTSDLWLRLVRFLDLQMPNQSLYSLQNKSLFIRSLWCVPPVCFKISRFIVYIFRNSSEKKNAIVYHLCVV